MSEESRLKDIHWSTKHDLPQLQARDLQHAFVEVAHTEKIISI
jgi:hypothetical protein